MLPIINSISYRSLLNVIFAIAIPFLYAATAKAEQNFIAYLDGPHAQTNSAGKGFVAIAYRENGQTSFKAKWTGTSPGTSFAVLTDQGTWMFDISLQGTFATVAVSEYISPERLELLKQGRVRFIVRTETHPLGEIAGSSQPYSAYVGRIGGANVNGGHPTAVGLGGVFVNKDETDAIFYLKYAGFEQNGVSVIVDQRTVIGGWANASGIVMDVYSSYGTFTDAVKERLRHGTFVMAVSQNFLTARGTMRPVNRVVDFNGDNRSDLSVYRPSEGLSLIHIS
ncbi:MAG: hypothetical protein QUS14_07750, partial [Pyrinomonadaceae bacterium]|nr:hypothetical protein [Pyrinomonadaceae bacterium]